MTGEDEVLSFAVDYDAIQAAIEQALSQRPELSFLDVPFEDYTVTDGLLLLILLSIIIIALFRFIGRCFSWLR